MGGEEEMLSVFKTSTIENTRNFFLEHLSNLTLLFVGLLIGALIKRWLF